MENKDQFVNMMVNDLSKLNIDVVGELYDFTLDKYTIYQLPISKEEQRKFVERFVNGKNSDYLYNVLCDDDNAEPTIINEWVESKYTDNIEEIQYAYYVWGHALFMTLFMNEEGSRIDYPSFIIEKAIRFQDEYNLKIKVSEEIFYDLVDNEENSLYETANLLVNFLGDTLIAVGL